jgi:hypothetical protein
MEYAGHRRNRRRDRLSYNCVGRHMKRLPYLNVYDMDGYRFEEWKYLGHH